MSEPKYTTRTWRQDYYCFTEYKGDPVAVVQAVATSIRNCHVVQCYEHMLTRVHKVTPLPDNKLEVITFTSEYAGD